MLNQASLAPTPGSTKKPKRVGRGNGSGNGTYSGRGVKGQGSRTGNGKFNAAFEGGQTPLFRVINVDVIERLAASGIKEIDSLVLVEKGLVRKGALVKVLGNGTISTAVTLRVNKASAEAAKKIEAAGGKIELI